MKVIIDAMGGDNAPIAIVKGTVDAVRQYGYEAVLVGSQNAIAKILREKGMENDKRITIVHAEGSIDMDEKATAVVGSKKDSSMSVALNMLKDGGGDALVSAGSTGAVLAGATLITKRIKGIRRAALVPNLPTKNGSCLLIDCGANVECTPEYLLQFAYMGHFYALKQMGIENPRVGLINNGAEETKGTELLKATHALLKAAGEAGRINFVGNVEGRGIAEGEADVLVCDGFTGNIVLKTIEGVGMFFAGMIKKMFMKNIFTKISALFVKTSLNEMKKAMDYKEVGGAPLLGISKPIIKAHGSSDEKSFKNAIVQAAKYYESGIIKAIEDNIEYMTVSSAEK